MSALGVMFFGCPTCHTVRPLTISLTPSGIGGAMRRGCLLCANKAQTRRAGRQAEAAEYLADEIRFINEIPEVAARRLGTTPEALARRFYRVGMVDLARQFQVVATKRRYAQRKATA